jgi:hypothetical protein
MKELLRKLSLPASLQKKRKTEHEVTFANRRQVIIITNMTIMKQ